MFENSSIALQLKVLEHVGPAGHFLCLEDRHIGIFKVGIPGKFGVLDFFKALFMMCHYQLQRFVDKADCISYFAYVQYMYIITTAIRNTPHCKVITSGNIYSMPVKMGY